MTKNRSIYLNFLCDNIWLVPNLDTLNIPAVILPSTLTFTMCTPTRAIISIISLSIDMCP